MSEHCPSCTGVLNVPSRQETDADGVVIASYGWHDVDCPGLVCPTCADLQAATRRLVEAAHQVCHYPGPDHWATLEAALADPTIVSLRRE